MIIGGIGMTELLLMPILLILIIILAAVVYKWIKNRSNNK